MKNIMLMCNAGMSTSVLVRKMERVVEERNLELTIWAISETDFEKIGVKLMRFYLDRK